MATLSVSSNWPILIMTLRDEFRMFRVERIATLALMGASFRPRRAALLRDYQAILDAT